MCVWKNGIATDFRGPFRLRYDDLISGAPVALNLLGVEHSDDGYRYLLVRTPGHSVVEIKATPHGIGPRRVVRNRGVLVQIDSLAAYTGQEFRLTPGDDDVWTLYCETSRCLMCMHEEGRCAGNPSCWFCHVERHQSEACGDDFRTCAWCNKDRHEYGECDGDVATCFTCYAESTQAA